MAWTKLVTKCGCIQYVDIPEHYYDWELVLFDGKRAAKKRNEDLSNYYPVLKRRFEFTGGYESNHVRVFVEAD